MANENEEKRETLADIVAEIRAYGDRPPPKCAWLDIAERIEAIDSADAWRSLYTPGNAAAMREALEYVLQFDATDEAAEQDGLTDAERIAEYADHISECQKKARAALSAPARNCDRFADAEAARQAWLDDAENWDEFGSPELELYEWLLAPAAERKGEGDENK